MVDVASNTHVGNRLEPSMIAILVLAAQSMIVVPDAVRKDLDATCAGWQLAAVLPEIADEIKTRTPTWPPNLLPGDFNGDREVDVAVLMECKGTVQLIAFVARDGGFAKTILEPAAPHDARQFLHLIRKEYGHDAIGVEYEGVGGHAWIFSDGKWRSVAR
jgi:hypothetical protein